MELNGERIIPASVEATWVALNDPEILRCLVGSEMCIRDRRHLKVHTLTFGTRLTNITRALRNRDPDVALALAAAQVQDWKGGTRIASCLDDFNRHWARRLLGANAALLLVTDGLDRDEHGELTRAAQQLRLFARQIVWLNPLLRFDRFEPRAGGVKALLPCVDRFLPVHNLASLADLATALQSAPPARR